VRTVKFDISASSGVSHVGRADLPETVAKRKGRKATGCVTKDQLLGAMLSDGSAERRVRIQAPSGGAHQADGEATSPPSKRKGRKATGVLTKDQLLAVLQLEEDDDVSEGDSRQGTRGKGVTISAPEKADTSDDSDGSPVARKATGCVTKQQLLAIETQDDSDDEQSSEDKEDQLAKNNTTIHAPSAPYAPYMQFASSLFEGTCGKGVTIAAPENAVEGHDEPGNSSAKQGGGPKRAVGGSERKVIIMPPVDTDKSDDSDGSPVARKATGCVTKQQLLAIAMQDDSDDEQSSEDKEDQVAVVQPKVPAEGWQPKPKVGQPKVRFDTKKEVSEFPALLTAPRRRGRKATGVATKEQLLEAMSASGRGGGVAFVDSEGDGAAEVVRKRCAGRKGTAFVPAAQ